MTGRDFREALDIGPILAGTGFLYRGQFLVSSGQHQMYEFVQHGEAPGFRNLLAIDTDCRKRRPQQRHAAQLGQRHFAELKNQNTQGFDGRAPCRPCPPFIRPFPLLIYRKIGRRSQPCANLDRRLIEPGTQRKRRDRLTKLSHQVKRVLPPSEHLPQRQP